QPAIRNGLQASELHDPQLDERCRTNGFKDLPNVTTRIKPKTPGFQQLSPILSRFYPQALSIQRFSSCSPAKIMIPQDRRGRVYILIWYRPGASLTEQTGSIPDTLVKDRRH